MERLIKLNLEGAVDYEVDYLGYRISSEGLRTAQSKVKAVLDAPTPRNLSELKCFLGLVNYYARFLPSLAEVCHPLNDSMKKDVAWKWSKACEEAFQKLKELLTSTKVLCHYDVKMPLTLACDASSHGIGAVISHILPNREERPIAYASRTLSKFEKNYAQIEKEALAIVFGVKRFHQFLYGRQYCLITDHKPLVTIFGPESGIPPIAAARLQRWVLILSSYRYTIQYTRTQEHGNADGLSRLPTAEEEHEDSSQREAGLFSLRQINMLPVTVKDLVRETDKDSLLSQVKKHVLSGWPSRMDQTNPLYPYSSKQTQFTREAGCLMCGHRVVVPESLREPVVHELHEGHMGVVRMKALSRIHVWWPQIDKGIESLAKSCMACQQNGRAPPSAPLHPWSWPSKPMYRCHVDFAGPFMGKMSLLLVDAYSKWLEVIPMTTTSAASTIDALRSIFARFGIPHQLVSDNGPQCVSAEFNHFMEMNGIKHIRSAPYHLASNGQVERAVQTMKKTLRVMQQEEGSLTRKLSRFLLSYRSTAHSTNGETPSDLFLGRKLRTRLEFLKPSVQEVVLDQQGRQRQYQGRRQERYFNEKDTIWVRDYRSIQPWVPGKIVKVLGPLTYEVEVEGTASTWKRHVDRLKHRSVERSPEDKLQEETEVGIVLPTAQPNMPAQASSTPSVPVPTVLEASSSSSDEKDQRVMVEPPLPDPPDESDSSGNETPSPLAEHPPRRNPVRARRPPQRLDL
ncbi:uncharacterized protein K02A2.6-like [Corticium candelabrum]|uniref:uncharacterized protein K02A2.6-like n=1 Tax=Corticium candelabrum TaxID=121492 RepID=UPI002E25D8B5|nr:uncharacterized protein K02A2.6-like [Corticium candelabrum]